MLTKLLPVALGEREHALLWELAQLPPVTQPFWTAVSSEARHRFGEELG